jgi:nucleotide-binding universal stress UspA family protein
MEPAGVRYRAQLMGDDPADAILAAAARDEADLIVGRGVGERGVDCLRSGVTYKLAHYAHQLAVIVPCSVLPGSTG